MFHDLYTAFRAVWTGTASSRGIGARPNLQSDRAVQKRGMNRKNEKIFIHDGDVGRVRHDGLFCAQSCGSDGNVLGAPARRPIGGSIS